MLALLPFNALIREASQVKRSIPDKGMLVCMHAGEKSRNMIPNVSAETDPVNNGRSEKKAQSAGYI